MGSAYFIGNFVGSFLGGWLADRLGRRPILLVGVTATIIFELFFGFSQTFAWAIIARLLWGLLNGNIGVVKTYISEVSMFFFGCSYFIYHCRSVMIQIKPKDLL